MSEKIASLSEANSNLLNRVSSTQLALDDSHRAKDTLNAEYSSLKRDMERTNYSLSEVDRTRDSLLQTNERLNIHIQQLEKRERELSEACRGSDQRIDVYQDKIVRAFKLKIRLGLKAKSSIISLKQLKSRKT